MKLVLDINKALNMGKLVKRAVQVKGKDGKVFTRMQWINPEDASTGHGVRNITDEQSYHQAIQDGVHHHPQFGHALADQGVHMHLHDFKEHPSFHLPETEQSAKKFLSRQQGSGEHIPHGGSDYATKPHHNESMAMHKYDAHPEIHRIKDAISESVKETNIFSNRIKRVSSEITKHEHIIHHHVRDYIEQDDTPDHVKNIQRKALDRGDVESKWSLMSMHPHVLSHVIDTILGDRAQEFRDAAKGDLTINFGDNALEGIKSDGYYSSTPEQYIKRMMGEDASKQYQDIVDSVGSDEHKLEKINDLYENADPDADDDNSLAWGDVHERLSAEYTSIGLSVNDPKPTYLALNAGNKPEGGAVDYGDHFLTIKNPEELLKNCTATIDDTFYETSAVPKIWSMDHLVDMMVLKSVAKKANKIAEGTSAKAVIQHAKGTIPIEVQYHHQSIPRHMYDIKEYK